MQLTIKTLENMTNDTVHVAAVTKIYGCPTQINYENLKKEASDLASKLDDITYFWSQSLAEIIGKDKYQHLTNLTRVQELKPATYNPVIKDTTTSHTRKRMEQEWERMHKMWSIRKGFP